MLCMSSFFDYNSDIMVIRLKVFFCSWLFFLREGLLCKGEKLFLLGGLFFYVIGEVSVFLVRYVF